MIVWLLIVTTVGSGTYGPTRNIVRENSAVYTSSEKCISAKEDKYKKLAKRFDNVRLECIKGKIDE